MTAARNPKALSQARSEPHDPSPEHRHVLAGFMSARRRAMWATSRTLSQTACSSGIVSGKGVTWLAGTAAISRCGAGTKTRCPVEPDARRRAAAEAMGAFAVVAPDDEGLARVARLFGGEGADAVFEAASSWAAIRTGMELARTDGRVIVVSRHTERPDYNPVGHPFLGKRLRLITSYGYPPPGARWDRAHSIALALDFLTRGRLPLGPMLTHDFDRNELPEIYWRMDGGERSLIGVVLQW